MESVAVFRRFSALVHELYRLQTPADVLSTLTAHLPRLTPHDIAVPAVTDRASGAVRLEAGPLTYRESYTRHADEDASRLAHLRPRHPGAVRLSDLVPRRALEHAPIWTEVMRPHRIRHVMTMCLHESAQVVGVLKLVRSGHGGDFSMAERSFMDAVARHVRQAYANAEALTRFGADPERAGDAVGSMSVAAMVVRGAGTVVHQNRLVDRTLARCVGPAHRRGPAAASSLPSRLQALLIPGTGETTLVGRGGATFTARAARIDGVAPAHYVLVLEEQEPAGAGSLSPREREVMRWVAQGKTNVEIGIILDISARTVQTHLDHVFAKLGVSRRAQAVAALARREG